MHRQSIVYVDRASFVFLILMHPDVCTASVFFFFSSLPCAYCKTKHQLGGYLALYVDGKRTPTILFVELSSRARSNSALARNERYSFVLCIGKKRTRRKKIWDNTKKWERKERGREREREEERRDDDICIYTNHLPCWFWFAERKRQQDRFVWHHRLFVCWKASILVSN